jgi:hypothetical protein
MHLILSICRDDDLLTIIENNSGRQVAAPTVSTIIGHIKRFVSMKIGYSIWQKSYHDRIIRNEKEYLIRWQYIDENPIKLEEDEYYNM